MFKRHFVAESSTPARKSCFGLKKLNIWSSRKQEESLSLSLILEIAQIFFFNKKYFVITQAHSEHGCIK